MSRTRQNRAWPPPPPRPCAEVAGMVAGRPREEAPRDLATRRFAAYLGQLSSMACSTESVFDPLLLAQSETPVQKLPWPTAGGMRSEASKPIAVAPLAMAFATFSL